MTNSTHDKPNLPQPPEQPKDPHPDSKRFVGRRVSFKNPACPTSDKCLVGIVETQEFIGFTARGGIPDYRLSVRGASGKTLTISLVESYASIT